MNSVLNKDSTIYIAGHRGMVGSAIVSELEQNGYNNIITRSRKELDLLNQASVSEFFSINQIDYVVLAAARVGGIFANNTYPADFIYQNLMIQANVIHQAYAHGVKRLLFLGSSCIYPRQAEQPMSEGTLLAGKLEPTNEPYAVAKIAGIKMCESYNRQYGTFYRSVMPTNLYGPNDNFHPENSHVVPALMRRIHEAKMAGEKQVVIWGSGKAKREFLHVSDMATASVFVMQLSDEWYAQHTQEMVSHINVGTGEDVSINQLAELLSEVIGFQGCLEFDSSKPDGAPRKLLDVSRIKTLGWQSGIGLEQGLRDTYGWYLESQLRMPI
ncbi:MAG: GDP-L-fucose synthase [Proteobacteria bacterium]|nr:GDP-L-fucose synthase [Pseudomonadota bacterium]